MDTYASNGNFCQNCDVIKVMILMMLKIHKHSGLNSIRAESPPDISEHLCKLLVDPTHQWTPLQAVCWDSADLSEHLCKLLADSTHQWTPLSSCPRM